MEITPFYRSPIEKRKLKRLESNPGEIVSNRPAKNASPPASSRLVPKRQALAPFRRALENVWRTVVRRLRRPAKLLIVSETASLGDRRIVSVVQFGPRRFLIGCAGSSLTLLATLPDEVQSEPSTANLPQPSLANEESNS